MPQTPLSLEAQNEVSKLRAQTDAKLLKRLMREYYNLLQPTVVGPELEAAHETFLLSLEQLTMHLSKAGRTKRLADREVADYKEEESEIENASLETSSKIDFLRSRLESAQLDRARAIQYDGLAKIVGKLPNREQGLETQKKLSEDIAVLKAEQKTYRETWTARQAAFDEIVQSLTSMSEAIACVSSLGSPVYQTPGESENEQS